MLFSVMKMPAYAGVLTLMLNVYYVTVIYSPDRLYCSLKSPVEVSTLSDVPR